jgi:inner membrane protease subunit 2
MCSTIKILAKGLVVCLPVAISFRDLVGFPAGIEGNSMTPTLNPTDRADSDVVWVDRVSLLTGGVRHGDVVAAVCPQDPKERIVKRVIALEGDIVRSPWGWYMDASPES